MNEVYDIQQQFEERPTGVQRYLSKAGWFIAWFLSLLLTYQQAALHARSEVQSEVKGAVKEATENQDRVMTLQLQELHRRMNAVEAKTDTLLKYARR